MNFPPRSLSARRSGGFTLIELLVVIAIIAILAAIAFPTFGKMQNRARSVQASSDMRSIKTAVAAYFVDYQKYPVTGGQIYNAQTDGDRKGQDSLFGDPDGYYWSADLFDTLRAKTGTHFGNVDNELNPKQVVYWEGPTVKDPAKPRSGITTQDVRVGTDTIHKGSLVDPWGNQYIVWFNVTKSGDLTESLGWFYYDEYGGSTPKYTVNVGPPPIGVECASLGPDGKWGKKDNHVLRGSDDVATWSY